MNNYQKIYSGKVRTIYKNTQNDKVLLMKATDRLSSYDRNICEIPDKGKILNLISIWWLKQTKHFVPNHFIKQVELNSMEVVKCTPFPIEFVVRAYMTGTTNTSIWVNYQNGIRNFCGNSLREGYKKNQILDEIIITPTTKDKSDKPITPSQIVNSNIMTQDDWDLCKKYSFELFKYGQLKMREKGLILVDTKYEFGKDENGNILLIDEIHTPDSSRFWFSKSYNERFLNNEEPKNIDKDIIRKWIIKQYNPYDAHKINVPNELIQNVSNKYKELYEIIIGSKFF